MPSNTSETASPEAKFALGAALACLILTSASMFLGPIGPITFWMAVVVAPIAVILSSVAMTDRRHREVPQSRLPIFALALSIASVVLLAYTSLLAWGAGQMH
jgi:hypothetical protein